MSDKLAKHVLQNFKNRKICICNDGKVACFVAGAICINTAVVTLQSPLAVRYSTKVINF